VARRIVSIAAAPGWSAEIESKEPGGENGRVTLVGWALIQDDDGESVVGLVLHPRTESDPRGRVGLADEEPRFLGYTFAGMRTQAG
jgi:hypothetical protein